MTNTVAPEMNPEQAALLARRVRMMMLIAGLTTALGMAAILITIGYRLFRTAPAMVSEVTAMLPKGARVVSTAVAGDRVIVTVETGTGLEIRIFDAHTLKQTGWLRFASEP